MRGRATRAIRLAAANSNLMLLSDGLETGTVSSNSLPSANESLRTDNELPRGCSAGGGLLAREKCPPGRIHPASASQFSTFYRRHLLFPKAQKDESQISTIARLLSTIQPPRRRLLELRALRPRLQPYRPSESLRLVFVIYGKGLQVDCLIVPMLNEPVNRRRHSDLERGQVDALRRWLRVPRPAASGRGQSGQLGRTALMDTKGCSGARARRDRCEQSDCPA
jgi:hypothetical protein